LEVTVTKQNFYPTLKVVATAIAAYEFNRNSIVRSPVVIDDIQYQSSRQLISDYLLNNVGPFVVNEFHQKQAEGIIAYLQHVGLMQTLRNSKVDNFLGNVVKLIAEENIGSRDIGIVAWAPKLADDYQKKDNIREVSARYEHRSNWVGTVGEKTVINFSLIEKRYIHTMDCTAVYGNDDAGNLIFYWAKDSKKIIESGRIQGRIKAHNIDKFRGNACVTTLNYVKVL